MFPPQSVLIAIDAAGTTPAALEAAGVLCRALAPETILLFHASGHPEKVHDRIAAEFPGLLKAGDATSLTNDMQDLMRLHLRPPATADISIEIRQGDRMAELLSIAAERRINLIVMGAAANGSRGFAARIATQAPCSVLVAPDHCKSLPRSLLVPLDYSPDSAMALRVALDWARAAGIHELILHHCARVPNGYSRSGLSYEAFGERMKEHARNDQAEFLAGHDLTGLNVTETFVYGRKPAFTILNNPHMNSSTAVVMGARGRTPLANLLLGSVTEEVIRRAEGAVLAVRETRALNSLDVLKQA